MENLISVSQLQTFLSCKKKWEYNYIEKIKPRVDRKYLTIGKLCHKGMQVAMQMIWQGKMWEEARDHGIWAMREEWSSYLEETPLIDEELPEFEQMLIDAHNVFKQAFEEFEPWKYEVVDIAGSPALEYHFTVPCPPMGGLQGYIDAILRDKETGFIWCTDYKFRKTLSPDDEEAFNIQNTVYTYACKQLGVDITGTLTWQHCNTPASDPQMLKNGSVSKAKIKTTWNHYKQFCEKHNIDPSNYEDEMKEKLSDIEWFRATYEYRNDETVNNIWIECVLPASIKIKKAHEEDAWNFRSMYPWNCKMCQYQSLCQAELRNYDVEAIRQREYVKK